MLKVNPTATVQEAPGFRRMFRASRLTLGVFFPIEAFNGDAPSMRDQERRAKHALISLLLWVGYPGIECVADGALQHARGPTGLSAAITSRTTD